MKKGLFISTISILNFIILMGFVLAGTKPPVDDLKTELITDWKWAREYTLAYIETMPEDQLQFKPTEQSRSFAEQMLHITGSNFGFSGQALGISTPLTMEELLALEKNKNYHNKQALTDIVAQSYDFVISGLESTDPSSLNDQISMFNQFNVTRTKGLKKAFIHQNHHRAQTAPYLRLVGVVPPPQKLFY